MDQELARQLTHLVFSLLMAALASVLVSWQFIALLILLLGLGGVFVLSKGRISRYVLHILERERNKQIFPGKGAFLLTTGILLTAIVFPGQLVPAILVLGISDSVATYAGKTYGKKKIYTKARKSWVGVIAFFACSCAILYFFTSYWLLVAAVVTGVEAIEYNRFLLLDDNLLIPLATAALLILF